MTYALGLDLGTTYTAAAVWRDGSAEMVGLGTHGHVIPSVVHLRDDGRLVTGEAAVRRAVSEPDRTGREFKRRLGDPTPILLGGTPFAASDLMTALLRDVVAAVAEREGAAPDAVALTHPANWGQFKVDLLRQAADACGLSNVTLVTEPVAAAVHYAAGARVAPGQIVAVYDLGGGTFDVAVLRRTPDGFETLGEPAGLERLGGVDFDHAVVAHVERALAEPMSTLSPDDPEVVTAMARLRQECVTAKEGLSEDSEVAIPVALPGVWTEVRVTRREFEALIAPALVEPMRAFNRAIGSAGIAVADIHAVLLVGGSSRIPLVAETVAGTLGRKVAIDTHPKHAVALGAARIVGTAGSTARPTPQPSPAEVDPAGAPAAVMPRQPKRSGSKRPAILVGAVAVVAAAVGAFAVLGGGDASTSSAAADRAVATTEHAEEDPSTPEADEAPGSTAPALPQIDCGTASGICALITNIELDGDRYLVDYATLEFDPLIPGEDAGAEDHDHHVHFFFDSTAPADAGVNGTPPGSWEVWGLQRGGGVEVFDEFTVSDAAGARNLCVAVATSSHAVLEDAAKTGNCVELPG